MSEIDGSNKKTLVGSFFLGDARHPWMGRVIEALGERGTYYFVECFAKQPSDVQSRRVVSVHDMSHWMFFGTVYQMRRNLAAAREQWEAPVKLDRKISEFFMDMATIQYEEELTGQQIYQAWLDWSSKDRK